MTEDEIRADERERLADMFELERLAVVNGPHPETPSAKIIASVLRDVVGALRFDGDGLTQNMPRGFTA